VIPTDEVMAEFETYPEDSAMAEFYRDFAVQQERLYICRRH
jgi:hypothetical protein